MEIIKSECKTRMCDNCESVDNVKLINHSSDCMFLCKECRKELYNLLKEDLAPTAQYSFNGNKIISGTCTLVEATHLKDEEDKHGYKRNSK